MHYQETPPHSILAPYIKCIWTLEMDENTPKSIDKILPDGTVEMIFHFGKITDSVNENGESISAMQNCVVGQADRFMLLKTHAGAGMVSVRFTPMGLSYFTDMPMHKLTNSRVEFKDIWGNAANDLNNMLWDAGTFNNRVAIINKFFIALLKQKQPVFNRRVETALAHIHLKDGVFRVKELADKVAMSERNFNRRFTESVGLSPKAYSKLVHLQHIISKAQAGESIKFTLMDESKYYDYSHMVKDFTCFTGETPTEYFKSDNYLTNLFWD